MAHLPGPTTATPTRFARNVLWTWVAGLLNIFTGFVLSPYVIHKLGPEGYGVWALLFSIIGYYGMVDLGVRPALTRFCAYFHARRNFDQLNELINTVIGYYTFGALVLLVVSLYISGHVDRIFHVSPGLRDDFARLIVIVGVSAMIGINVFAACIEGLQRFEIGSRISVATIGIRSLGAFLLLYFGYGLFALGLNVLFAQIVGYIFGYFAFRKVFPELRLSPRLVKVRMLRHIASYSIHAFFANVASQLLIQSPPILIGVFRPAAFIGYFSFPSRLVQYSLDFIDRVGYVSASSAAEMAAKGARDRVLRLAVYSNRYCLTLLTPIAMFLLLFGRPLIRVWISPSFAEYSAPLLPGLLLGACVALAAQYNSIAVLFGIAKHQAYAYGLAVEAALSLSGLLFAIPRFGILGAVWASVIPMILVRGLFTPWVLCRNLDASLPWYLASIFVRPALSAAPIFALALWGKLTILPGRNWPQLIAAGFGTVLLYWGLCFFTALEPGHRALLKRSAVRLARYLRLPLRSND